MKNEYNFRDGLFITITKGEEIGLTEGIPYVAIYRRIENNNRSSPLHLERIGAHPIDKKEISLDADVKTLIKYVNGKSLGFRA